MIKLPWGAIWKDPHHGYGERKTPSGYVPYDAKKNKPVGEFIPVACKHCGATEHLFARNQDCTTIVKPGLPPHTFPTVQFIPYMPAPKIDTANFTVPGEPPVIWMLRTQIDYD
jgi:hypothetical protein